MNGPMITGGGKVRKRYQIGEHQAVLVESPESVGPIKYKYVFMVFDGKSEEPILIITSEKNEMQAALLAVAAQRSPELAAGTDPNKYFIGVFHNGVHSNMGGSLDWADLNKFELQAFLIAKEKLNYSDDVKVSVEKSSNLLSKAKNIFVFFAFIAVAAILFKTVGVVGDWFQNNPWWLNIAIFVGIGWLGSTIFEKFSSKKNA